MCKDQPNVNHLDVGCGRKTLCNTYEQSGQNQKRSQIDRDDSFKEEILEKIGGINDDEDDEGWKVDSEKRVVDPPFQRELDMNSHGRFF